MHRSAKLSQRGMSPCGHDVRHRLRPMVLCTLLSFMPLFQAGAAPAATATGDIPEPAVEDGSYVPNEIIIQLTPSAVAETRTATSKGNAGLAAFPASVRALNERFDVKSAARLFRGFEEDRRRLAELRQGKRRAETVRDARLLRRLQRAPEGSVEPDLSGTFKLRLELSPDVPLESVLAAYRSDPNVAYAEPNRIVELAGVPNDPHFSKQWALHNTGQAYPYSGSYNIPPGTPDADIDAVEAWDTQSGSTDIVVAVIDTGIDYAHRDLAANAWTNAAEAGGTAGVDDDGNGFIDDVHGYDFCSYGQARDSDPADDHGHGTHAAGIVAAAGNNGLDIAGVAWNAKVMPIKHANSSGEGTTEDAADAIYYAVANGADILSMSWGSMFPSDLLRNAVAFAESQGVLNVAAAGNDNRDYLFYPGRYYDVLNVGATDSNDEKASFSNYCCWIEVAAPGVDILSLRAAGLPMGTPYDNYTTTASGTSMACPYAAGVAALVLSQHPAFTPDEVRSVLKMTADSFDSPEYLGQGRVNAAQALAVTEAPVVAFLDMDGYLAEQGPVSGMIDIHGTAKGATFARYTLSFGEGANPQQWTEFHSAVAPVDNGVLYAGFNLDQLWFGLWTIKLSVFDTEGRHVDELRYVRLLADQAAFPMGNDILKPGGVLELRSQPLNDGLVLETIEFGLGYSPTEWFTAGITLDASPFDDILGTWDTSSITGNGFYTLRYTFSSPWGSREAYARSIYFDTRLREGWPRYVGRNVTPGSEISDIAFLAVDLEGDGRTEVLVLQEGDYYGDGEPVLWAYNHDGSVRWSRTLDYHPMIDDQYFVPYGSQPIAGDVDKDGYQEIFVDVGNGGNYNNYSVYGIRHDGSDMEGQWPLDLRTGNSEKALADVNADGFLELVVRGRTNLGAYPTEPKWRNHVYVVDRLGAVLKTIEVGSSGVGRPERYAMVAVGNFDADAALEIATPYAVRTGTGLPDSEYPALYNPDGTPVPGWPVASLSYGVFALVTGDLDGDGIDELITAQAKDPETGVHGGFYAYNAAGQVLPGWPVHTELGSTDYENLGVALSDLDRDGDVEICVAFKNRMELYDRNGQLLPGWPQINSTWSAFKGSPVLADVNGDGEIDVLARGGAMQPTGLQAGQWENSGGLWAWNRDGSRIDLCPDSPSLYPIWMELYYEGRVAVADLDGNGLLDVIAGSYNNASFGDSTVSKHRDSVYVWELPVPYDPDTADWPAGQGGPAASGQYAQPGSVPVAALAIRGPALVAENSTVSYYCVATFADGTTRNVNAAATWSDNASFAAINQGVLATGSVDTVPTVVITAEYGGLTQTYTVTVDVLTLVSLAIQGPDVVNENSTASYTCVATYDDDSTSDVTGSAAWSEDSPYASISAAGVLTAGLVTGERQVTVTASYRGLSSTHPVTIWDLDVPSVSLLSGAGAIVTVVLLGFFGARRAVRSRRARRLSP